MNLSYFIFQLRGSHSFPVVVSQAPTPATAADYWLMVWQLQTELIVCLHTLPEVSLSPKD
jgi:protein tyrosine phosphatase